MRIAMTKPLFAWYWGVVPALSTIRATDTSDGPLHARDH